MSICRWIGRERDRGQVDGEKSKDWGVGRNSLMFSVSARPPLSLVLITPSLSDARTCARLAARAMVEDMDGRRFLRLVV